jgi:acyl-CoA reductase-like NAD-dependent aldehyde dehydrogenase
MSTAVEAQIRAISGCNYIDGQWVKSAGPLREIVNPATEEVIGHFADATKEEVDRAVEIANKAQRQWWALSALDRANALHRVAERMIEWVSHFGNRIGREELQLLRFVITRK